MGSVRQAKRLADKAEANDQFYSNLPRPSLARQFVRSLAKRQAKAQRKMAKMAAFNEAKSQMKVRKSFRAHPERAWATVFKELGWNA